MLLLNSHARKSFTTLLLSPYLFMLLYFYGLPFVVGLPLLLVAVVSKYADHHVVSAIERPDLDQV